MPVGPFENFAACLAGVQADGKTEAEARRICGAMEKDAMGELDGRWIEVFKTGDYGEKGNYTTAELDKIAAAYDPKLHAAPVVVGHPATDSPAFGWVAKLKRAGDSLWAQLEKVQPALEQAVKDGRFTQRSVALYRELPATKTPYLRHLGFLGASIPEVKGLEPINFQSGDAEHIEFAVNLEEKNMAEKDPTKELAAFNEKEVGTLRRWLQFFSGGEPEKPKEPAPAFTEAQVQDRIQAAVKPLAEKVTALEKEHGQFSEGQRTAGIRQWWAAQLAKGKLLPAFEEAYGLRTLLERLADSTVTLTFTEKGADGKPAEVKRSPVETLERFLGELGQVVNFDDLTRRARTAAARGGRVTSIVESGRVEVSGLDKDARIKALVADSRKTREKPLTYAEAMEIVNEQEAGQAPEA